MFDAHNMIYTSTDAHKLLRAVSYLEVINIGGGFGNVPHRKLNLRPIENGVLLSARLH